ASNNGGAQGAVAIANLDSDDNQEIVVPGYYGIKVYDYNAGTLSLKCQNTNGKILGAPVIYDIDRDNQYEIIYTTANYTCLNNNICNNTLYIINASTCTTEKAIPLDIYSLVAPAIANLDSDSNLEIVVQGAVSAGSDLSKVKVYDYDTSLQWTYPSTGSIAMIDVSPNIADIDGDGNYDIILAKNSFGVLVLRNNGSILQEFNIEGQIGSSPVIGDLSGKGVAELSVKRAGSPIAVLTTLTGNNSLPVLDAIDNITAIAGELINLNASGQI
ncbi:hypothetical protein HYU06_03735, partial [Candidatus Woesearchaeota archaeon]|nr:hypothetical protein [Candidatus Woesearchaeota archaeon]